MTSDATNAPRMSICLHDADDREGIAIHAAWLPLVLLEGVRVKLRTTRGLSVLERFVIMALLELGDCTPTDLQEVASLPPELSQWFLSVLAQRGLAARRDDTLFVPHQAACQEALQSNRLPFEFEETRSFLWFPLSDELVLLEDSSGFVRRLRSVSPFAEYPIHDRWRTEKTSKLIRAAIEQGSLYGSGTGEIIDVLDDSRLDDRLPAYQCTAVLVDNASTEWRLTLLAPRRQHRKKADPSESAADGARDILEVPLTIPFLPGLYALWRTPLKAAQAHLREWLSKEGLGNAVFHNNAYQSEIDGPASGVIAEKQLLAQKLSVRVQIQREIEYAIPLSITPADDVARRRFSLDHAVRQLLAAPEASIALRQIIENGAHGVEEVIDRLWQLKFFGKVYDLRVSEDFAS